MARSVLFLCARAAQYVGQSVIAFVAGVFIDLPGDFRHGYQRRDCIAEGSRIIYCELLVDRIMRIAREFLGEGLVVGITIGNSGLHEAAG